MIEILLVIPSHEQQEYMNELAGGPSSGLSPMLGMKVSCQEEKGENPRRHKGIFEEDGEVDVWKLGEYFSEPAQS